MFVRVVSDAVSTQRNNAVIHHWIDFLLMTIPQFRQSLRTVVFPLIDCLVNRLRSLVQDFRQTYAFSDESHSTCEATDAEYTVLVNALERLLLMAISEAQVAAGDDEPKSADRTANESISSGGGGAGGGLLGYMTGVLGSSELGTGASEESGVGFFLAPCHASGLTLRSQPKQAALSRLRDCVNLLLLSWDVTSGLELTAEGDLSSTSQGYFSSRVKIRARKALERIYKAAPIDVVESVVWFWDRTRLSSVSLAVLPQIVSSRKLLQGPESEAKVFSMLDILAPSAQTIVSMLCEKLAPKSLGSSDKGKNQTASCVLSAPRRLHHSHDVRNQGRRRVLCVPRSVPRPHGRRHCSSSLERVPGVRSRLPQQHLQRSTLHLFLPSVSLAEPSQRSWTDELFPRCFTTLSERVSQTSALEDRRMRRDLQETFIRLVDASIQIAGRAVEQGGWVRRAVMDGTPTGAFLGPIARFGCSLISPHSRRHRQPFWKG